MWLNRRSVFCRRTSIWELVAYQQMYWKQKEFKNLLEVIKDKFGATSPIFKFYSLQMQNRYKGNHDTAPASPNWGSIAQLLVDHEDTLNAQAGELAEHIKVNFDLKKKLIRKFAKASTLDSSDDVMRALGKSYDIGDWSSVVDGLSRMETVSINGKTFGVYKDNCLGKGATAEVYLAKDIETGELIAYKEVTVNGQYEIEACAREMEILKARGEYKGHKRIGDKFIVCQKLLQGRELELEVQSPVADVNTQLIAIVNGLRDLKSFHQSGYVHRDIKPDNLMFDPATKTISLFDFNAAGKLKHGKVNGDICNRPLYIAPEIFSKDIWKLISRLKQMHMLMACVC